MAELSPRAKQILYACITEFVATGEPVGSRTLSKRGIELSPASIRNTLSDLEELGYLHQPHTSAGRIPTDRAFRLFIDAMMEVRELTDAENAHLLHRFSEMEPGPNFLRDTGRLLSELTGTAAVVVSPKAETMTLKHLRFIRTLPGEVLAVVVFTNGTVQNRFLKVDVTENELQKVHNLLDDVIEGRALGDVRELFARRLQSERVQHDDVKKRAFELGEAAIGEAGARGADVVIEGRSKLLQLPDFADSAGFKGLVSALEDEGEAIVRLLDATLAAGGTSIVVGREAGDLAGGHLAIVGASYQNQQGRTAGAVAVIGPTRMDYPKVVPLVTATANAMGSFIERRTESHRDDDDD